MSWIDPFEMLDKGRTGVYLVDMWLMAENPGGRYRSARIYRADALPSNRRAGT